MPRDTINLEAEVALCYEIMTDGWSLLDRYATLWRVQACVRYVHDAYSEQRSKVKGETGLPSSKSRIKRRTEGTITLCLCSPFISYETPAPDTFDQSAPASLIARATGQKCSAPGCPSLMCSCVTETFIMCTPVERQEAREGATPYHQTLHSHA